MRQKVQIPSREQVTEVVDPIIGHVAIEQTMRCGFYFSAILLGVVGALEGVERVLSTHSFDSLWLMVIAYTVLGIGLCTIGNLWVTSIFAPYRE